MEVKIALSSLFVISISAAIAIGGCGGRTLTYRADAAYADARRADARPAEDVTGLARSPSCGGTVKASGTTPDGPFTAVDIRIDRCDGDCAPLVVSIATSSTWTGRRLTLFPRPNANGSYLGALATQVLLDNVDGGPPLTLASMVAIVAADPENLTGDAGSVQATPFGAVTGTFEVHDRGVDISGTFSSPVCSSRLSI
jgi:hypothetical protein